MQWTALIKPFLEGTKHENVSGYKASNGGDKIRASR